jgi:type VI secretion system protein ImpK
MQLIDSFIQLIAYVVHFRDSVAQSQPDCEQVKLEIGRLISQSEKLRSQWELDPVDFDQARFMVFAWVDETLLASDWNQKQLWQHEQLQRLYYHTTDAGVEVFERLNNLEFHQRDVREVYYLCLSLGFKGRFIQQGDEFLLDQLKASNLKILLASPAGIPSLDTIELFPKATPTYEAVSAPHQTSFRFNTVTAVALAAPLVLFGLLYCIYYFALSGVAGKLS